MRTPEPAYRPLVTACADHGISRTVAFEMARDGLLETFTIGARRYVLLESLRTLLDVELHRLAFGQRAEAVRLDGAVVAENVVAAVILLDETKALRLVEPLHSSRCHVAHSLSFLIANGRG